MAGNWIKISKSLLDEKPEVRKLCRILGKNKFEIVGRLVAFWAWVDTHFENGEDLDIERDDIDDVADLSGFADALVKVGWLDGSESRYTIPHFDRHNGQTAKARALEAEAKRIRRDTERLEETGKDESLPDQVSDKCRTNVGQAPDQVSDKCRTNVGQAPDQVSDKCRTNVGQIVRPDKIRLDKIRERECESAGAKAVAIVSTYPRREKLMEAVQIVAKYLEDGEDYEAILAGTRAHAAVIHLLPSAHLNKFVPSALSFFRGKCWLDDPETMRRQGAKNTGQRQMSLEDAAKLLGGRSVNLTGSKQ